MAEKKFFVDINLQGSALTNAKIGTNSGIGSTEGAFGYDSSAHRLQYFDGTATKEVANLSDIAAITGGLILQGGYDPTTNNPNIIDDTTVLKGFFWVVTAAGTFLGQSVQVGDLIIAKIDSPAFYINSWLILQGNIIVATDSVDGISRLATQTEANDGTEAGAVVITPATLQGKIDAQITPEINSKVSKSGDTMSGNLDMGHNAIDNISLLEVWGGARKINLSDADGNISLYSNNGYVTLDSTNLNLDSNSIDNVGAVNAFEVSLTGGTILNVPTPTAGGDATNKTYVDGAASDAQAGAEAYADSLAPNYDAAGAAAQALTDANAYTDTEIAAQSYVANIEPLDWTLLGGSYYFDAAHGLATSRLIMMAFDNASDEYVELSYIRNGANTRVFTNILPVDTMSVSFVKAQ